MFTMLFGFDKKKSIQNSCGVTTAMESLHGQRKVRQYAKITPANTS